MDDVAIKVNNVSKDFLLPHEKVTSVKSLFTGLTKGLNFTKEKQHALEGITFEVKRGEFFGIVGRNGSGKSTLLKILAGIYQPTSGQVHVNGKLVPFIELGVGFNPELTGRENVYLNGAMLGFSKKEVSTMYDQIVNFAELGRFMDQKLKNYSSGMQVRLAFSMATRAKADILLVDEVLAVGDADFQRKCFSYFSQLKKNKITVVFVSHDMEAVREYCDRAMLVEASEIKAIGPTGQIAEQYIQLFNEKVHGISRGHHTADNRWGNGDACIKSVSATVNDEHLSIDMSIEIKKEVKDPVIGFRIRNGAGREVTGTNSKIERINTGSLAKGQKIKVHLSMVNILSEGDYHIDPSVINPDGTTVYDWWNEAVSLNVKKKRRLPYIVDPGFKIDISSL